MERRQIERRATYFDATFVPILAPGIVAMVIGPVLAWRRGNLPQPRGASPGICRRVGGPVIVFLQPRGTRRRWEGSPSRPGRCSAY
jgi:hypothetical protein